MFTADNIVFIIHKILGFICHQDPSLVLIVQEHSMPLCPRCIGMHGGFFLTIAILFLKKSARHLLLSINPIVILLPVAAMGIEWLLSNLHIYNSSLISRLLSGFIGGMSIGAFIVFFNIHHSLNFFFHYNKTIIIFLLSPVLLFLIIPAGFSHQSYWFFINLILAYMVIANLIIVGTTLILRIHLMIKYNKNSMS